MLGVLTAARLQTLVAQSLETHPGNVKAGGLLGIADPESDMVEAEEFASLRFRSLVGVAGLQG